MFSLHSDDLPTSADELARQLEQSLCDLIEVPKTIVTLREKAFPEFEEIQINLDEGQLRSTAVPASPISGQTSPAFEVGNFEVSARGMSVDGMPLDLALHASSVQLHQGRDRTGKLALVLHHAEAGTIDISVTKAELEAFASRIAKREAGKHGVTVDEVKLSLHSPMQRALEGTVQFRARKLFLSGVIRIAGKMDIDEKLTAVVSRLTCTGDGAISSLACNVLRPYLQRLDGRQLNLATLPLGDLVWHDVHLTAGEKVGLRAAFGSPA